MADDEERPPPPPSYEDAQRLLNSEVTVSTADNSDPYSVPLLANQSKISSNSESRTPATHSTSPPPYTGTTVFHADRLSSHYDPSSEPYPIFVCGACGARQRFGQFSPITFQGLPSQTVTSPSPIYVGVPVITNQRNPPYPVTGSITSHPAGSQSLGDNQDTRQQRSRNVAVHYNANQERAQAELDTDSISNNEDDDGSAARLCALFFFILVFFGAILLLGFTIS